MPPKINSRWGTIHPPTAVAQVRSLWSCMLVKEGNGHQPGTVHWTQPVQRQGGQYSSAQAALLRPFPPSAWLTREVSALYGSTTLADLSAGFYGPGVYHFCCFGLTCPKAPRRILRLTAAGRAEGVQPCCHPPGSRLWCLCPT